MAQRINPLKEGSFYHIYNRGTDKRVVFQDNQDYFQFLQMVDYFNNKDSLGHMRKYKEKPTDTEKVKLVEVHAYCLNPNHFHIVLKQIYEDGISRFMQKLSTGYTMYFNKKNERSGSLFQGNFKSKLIDTDEYLMYITAYVNLNNLIHGNLNDFRSSWEEYKQNKPGLCVKEDTLSYFKDLESYTSFAQNQALYIKENRKKINEIEFEENKNEVQPLT